MSHTVEKISAVTLRVSNMKASVQFYRDVLGMELLYGGETAGFSSLRAKHAESAILNLEEANTVTQWGWLIFYVADVDEVWRHLKERGFDPPQPQNASWGERYFHILDPDGHELVSFQFLSLLNQLNNCANSLTFTWRIVLVNNIASLVTISTNKLRGLPCVMMTVFFQHSTRLPFESVYFPAFL